SLGLDLTCPLVFLVSSVISSISSHLLLNRWFFEYANTFYLALSALISVFYQFTSYSSATHLLFTNRKVLMASLLLAVSLLLSYETYNVGRVYQWHSLIVAVPLLLDGRS
ncbi:hypothetical protein PFISCL1PPCAC_15245, partial [Pristionchus fissidentatus]